MIINSMSPALHSHYGFHQREQLQQGNPGKDFRIKSPLPRKQGIGIQVRCTQTIIKGIFSNFELRAYCPSLGPCPCPCCCCCCCSFIMYFARVSAISSGVGLSGTEYRMLVWPLGCINGPATKAGQTNIDETNVMHRKAMKP